MSALGILAFPLHHDLGGFLFVAVTRALPYSQMSSGYPDLDSLRRISLSASSPSEFNSLWWIELCRANTVPILII